MVKWLLSLFVIVSLFSCKEKSNLADFKGVWIDKNLINNTTTNAIADDKVRFPLIMIEQNKADSVLFYYDSLNRNIYPAHFSYDSYFIHFDKNKEYFLVYDYKKNEMVFSNLQNDEFHRFIKIKTDLTRLDVLSPNFNIDSLIQTVK
jgi:hypothetical protein